jgi:hypothetical protein
MWIGINEILQHTADGKFDSSSEELIVSKLDVSGFNDNGIGVGASSSKSISSSGPTINKIKSIFPNC